MALLKRIYGPLCVLISLVIVGLALTHPPKTVYKPLPFATTVATQKVLVIVYENKGYNQTIKGAPLLKWFGDTYAHATNYHAVTHPSQPNYTVMGFGSPMGIKDDGYHPFHGASIAGGTLKAGRTFKYYNESMGSTNCRTSNTGSYRQKHNWWTLAADERSRCKQFDVDAKALANDIGSGHLPNVGFLIPNICNDAHDCSLTVFDKWLRTWMPKIMAGSDWQNRNLTIVITADEDNKKEGNRVYTVLVNRSVRGKVITDSLSHYGLSKSLARYGGTAPLRTSVGATDVLMKIGK